LFELAGVGLDRWNVGIEGQCHVDVLAERAPEDPCRARHDRVDVEHFCMRALGRAERQQLLGQARGAQRGTPDLVYVLDHRIRGRETVDDQLGIAGNRRQQVIEIVSNPTRQAADRFHLLRLQLSLLVRIHRWH
jgi:hypothetical protein